MVKTVEVPEYEVLDRVEVRPTHTGLLVVDMQNDFVNSDGALFVEEAPKTVEACQRVLEFARGNGLFVGFTQDTHRNGDPEFEIWGEHVVEGTWGWEIIPELRPRQSEPVYRKARYDGFYGTQLDHDLRLLGIRDLILIGTVANICVHYTAASAGLRWYGVIIPVDCVSALTEFDKEASFRQAAWLFGARLTTSRGLAVAG